MTERPSIADRRSWAPLAPTQPSAFNVFQRGFLNASLVELAICTPPRSAFDREYDQVHIARLGERVRATGRETMAPAAA